jgi:hypothetical protein
VSSIVPKSAQPRESVRPDSLSIAPCPLPRPGDRILWYKDALPHRGVLLGHNWAGGPVIQNDFGGPSILESFEAIRVEDPAKATGPNWTRLPSDARIVRPRAAEREAFDALLARRTPPGPRYAELLHEIAGRGYETYVVGGTVRDILGGDEPKDVDIVTSIPLQRLIPLLSSMYRVRKFQPEALLNGHVRLGGMPGSGDPFIDLCVFKYRDPGTPDAVFGSDFLLDTQHRDFACNAIYYDPLNGVLIDPVGRGIADADERLLSVVANPDLRTPYHQGQLVIRYVKFCCRGFRGTAECAARIATEALCSLEGMHKSVRISYMKTQFYGRCPKDEREHVTEQARLVFVSLGADAVWQRLVHPFMKELLS